MICSYEAFVREQDGTWIDGRCRVQMVRYVKDMMEALDVELEMRKYRYWVKMGHVLCELSTTYGDENPLCLTRVKLHTGDRT